MKFQLKYLFLILSIIAISCKSRESRQFRGKELQHTNLETKENNDTETVIPKFFSGKVTAIKDGDTFGVLYKGREIRIRLAHIDCPEKKQAFGTKAKQLASDLCFGKTVEVRVQGKPDRYGRLIAEIITDEGVNVNKELVKNGLAWHYKKYSNVNEYAQLEIEARNKKNGLWSELNPIAPWVWRKTPKENR